MCAHVGTENTRVEIVKASISKLDNWWEHIMFSQSGIKGVPWLLAGVVHIAWTLPLPSLAAPPSLSLGEHDSPDQPNREEHNTLTVTRGLTSKGHFQLSWLGSHSSEAKASCTSNSLYYLPSHTEDPHCTVLYIPGLLWGPSPVWPSCGSPGQFPDP